MTSSFVSIPGPVFQSLDHVYILPIIFPLLLLLFCFCFRCSWIFLFFCVVCLCWCCCLVFVLCVCVCVLGPFPAVKLVLNWANVSSRT